MQEGQFISHPAIANGASCKIMRIFGGYVQFELPNGQHQSIATKSSRGQELTVTEKAEFMPIIGLTDNNEGRLPYIGVLRKGGAKQEKTGQGGKKYTTFGKDLDHFRFTSDDVAVTERFLVIFGEQPAEITVQLPFATTDENFDAWKEAWAAGGLIHRCDGATMVRWQDKDGTYSDEPKPCDSHTKPERDRCKEVGRLKVFIPELGRMALVTVLTSSKHDIVNIHGALKILEKQRGSLTGIPFLLKRKEVEISANENGKRVTRKKWLIHIEPSPEWAQKLLAAQASAALPSAQPLALNAAPDDEMHDDGEFEALIDASYLDQIRTIAAEVGADLPKALKFLRVERLEDLSQEQADKLLKQLEAKREALAAQKPVDAAEPKGLDQWTCTQETGSKALAVELLTLCGEAEKVLGVNTDEVKKIIAHNVGEFASRKALTADQVRRAIDGLRIVIAEETKAEAA